jgi:hypothetical protein
MMVKESGAGAWKRTQKCLEQRYAIVEHDLSMDGERQHEDQQYYCGH